MDAINSPFQSITIGLLLVSSPGNVLSTNTAFVSNSGVVAVVVMEVVGYGTVVVSSQAYSSQGHPAGQFSLIKIR